MSDGSVADCCEACCGICCLTCCESILVALNFKKPGASSGSAQRGCCRNWGESNEEDEFEETARRKRLAASSESGGEGTGDKGVDKEGGDGPVTQQPAAPPPMTTSTSTNVTKDSTDETN